MFDFKVTPDDGDEFTVTADSRDVLAFERASKSRTLGNLVEDRSYVDLYRLAHIASKRQGNFTGTLDEFEKTCVLDTVDDEDQDEGGEDPTRTGRSTERSST